jgi:hypothetical protein
MPAQRKRRPAKSSSGTIIAIVAGLFVAAGVAYVWMSGGEAQPNRSARLKPGDAPGSPAGAEATGKQAVEATPSGIAPSTPTELAPDEFVVSSSYLRASDKTAPVRHEPGQRRLADRGGFKVTCTVTLAGLAP